MGIVRENVLKSGSLHAAGRTAQSALKYWRYRAWIALGDQPAATGCTSQAESVPVLLYHGINDSPDGASMPEYRFAEQMLTLRRAGYSPVRFDEFEASIKGRRTVCDKAFLLTFDDGRSDTFYGADPLLNALQWRAVMFVITN